MARKTSTADSLRRTVYAFGPVDWKDLDRLRNPGFSFGRRGYDRHEVDRFLEQLVQWLETDAARDLGHIAITRKLELVGKSTTHVLLAAEQEAEELLSQAEADIAELRKQAEDDARGRPRARRTSTRRRRARRPTPRPRRRSRTACAAARGSTTRSRSSTRAATRRSSAWSSYGPSWGRRWTTIALRARPRLPPTAPRPARSRARRPESYEASVGIVFAARPEPVLIGSLAGTDSGKSAHSS